MRRTILASTAACSLLCLTSCSHPSVSAGEAASPSSPETRTNKEEVVLSTEQQAAIAIETQAASFSEEPNLLRVKGSIALADDRTWRIGVRTVGSVVAVYKGLGDYVRKGEVLARYHADEVRDSRAFYRRAVAELARNKAAEVQAQRNRDRAW